MSTPYEITTLAELRDLLNLSNSIAAQNSSSNLVFVDFYATWCGPCVQTTPLVQQLLNSEFPDVIFAKVNVDQAPDLSGYFNVKGIPLFLIFERCQKVEEIQKSENHPLARMEGGGPETVEKIRQALRQHYRTGKSLQEVGGKDDDDDEGKKNLISLLLSLRAYHQEQMQQATAEVEVEKEESNKKIKKEKQLENILTAIRRALHLSKSDSGVVMNHPAGIPLVPILIAASPTRRNSSSSSTSRSKSAVLHAIELLLSIYLGSSCSDCNKNVKNSSSLVHQQQEKKIVLNSILQFGIGALGFAAWSTLTPQPPHMMMMARRGQPSSSSTGSVADISALPYEIYHLFSSLLECPSALEYLVNHKRYFEADGRAQGRNCQLQTFLGSLMGLGLTSSRMREQEEFLMMVQLFPMATSSNEMMTRMYSEDQEAAEDARSSGLQFDPVKKQESRNALHSGLEAMHQLCFPLVQKLLMQSAGKSREATLSWFGNFLSLNGDYAKEMPRHVDSLSTRTCLTNVFNVLISLALPIIESGQVTKEKIPVEYCFIKRRKGKANSSSNEKDMKENGDGKNPELVDFTDSERIGGVSKEDEEENNEKDESKFKEEEPKEQKSVTATLSPSSTSYPPKVHLFYLALHALHLAQTSLLLKLSMWKMQFRHPDVPAESKTVLGGLIQFHESILSDKYLAVRVIRFANGVAKWLLSVLEVDPISGILPSVPPKNWLSLPLEFVDDVIRTTKLMTNLKVNVEYYELDDIVSLMLILMGNETVFPKPHTHAIFPELLALLSQNPQFSNSLQRHRWFNSHILKCCMLCYITVGKCELERVASRYYLSLSLRGYLKDPVLCNHIRDTLEGGKSDLLEKFTHVVTAEANAALETVFECLEKMKEKEEAALTKSSGAATASTTSSSGQNSNNHANMLRQLESSDEEFSRMGESLQQSLMLFQVTLEVFESLCDEFRQGVLQHLVSHQICVMLVKSIHKLAGQRSAELKISNPEKYEFYPKKLVERCVTCFVKFTGDKEFLNFVPQCGVGMPDFFYACDNIVNRPLVPFQPLGGQLLQMQTELKSMENEIKENQEFWEDAPAECVCELLCTPLTNPVALPTTGKEMIIVNLDSIRQGLLDTEINPYNRKPMTLKDVEEFNATPEIKKLIGERKQFIEDWKREKRKGQQQQQQKK